MAGAEEQQAKQLDSVTDFVTESELDDTKAQEAMSALSSEKKEEDINAAALAAVTVAKEDVEVIVSELEVSEELADRVLREVGVESGEDKMLEKALRKLVTS